MPSVSHVKQHIITLEIRSISLPLGILQIPCVRPFSLGNTTNIVLSDLEKNKDCSLETDLVGLLHDTGHLQAVEQECFLVRNLQRIEVLFNKLWFKLFGLFFSLGY